MKKNKLSKIRLDEVSFVGAGANAGAKVILLKRLKGTGEPGDEVHNNQEDEEMDKEAMAKLEARLAKSESIGSMNDAQKTYLAALSAEKQEEFIKVEPAKREAFIKANPLKVDDGETLTVNGVSVKKSTVGEELFAIVKAQQATLDTMTTLVKQTTEAMGDMTLVQRVEKLLPNTPGTPEEKAKMLKSIDAMPSEQSKVALAALTAADRAIGERMKILGVTHQDSPVEKTAEAEYEALVAKEMEDSKVDRPTAYTRVMKKHPTLYLAYDQQTKNNMGKPN